MEIQRAQHEIRVQAYQLTSKPPSQALLEAHRRGVTVKTLADKTQESSDRSTVLALQQKGIPVRIDAKPRIAHNKVILPEGLGMGGELEKIIELLGHARGCYVGRQSVQKTGNPGLRASIRCVLSALETSLPLGPSHATARHSFEHASSMFEDVWEALV